MPVEQSLLGIEEYLALHQGLGIIFHPAVGPVRLLVEHQETVAMVVLAVAVAVVVLLTPGLVSLVV